MSPLQPTFPPYLQETFRRSHNRLANCSTTFLHPQHEAIVEAVAVSRKNSLGTGCNLTSPTHTGPKRLFTPTQTNRKMHTEYSTILRKGTTTVVFNRQVGGRHQPLFFSLKHTLDCVDNKKTRLDFFVPRLIHGPKTYFVCDFFPGNETIE